MFLFIEMELGVIELLLGLKKDVVEGVLIVMFFFFGMGFIVDEDGYILMNKYIVEFWKYLYIFLCEVF